MDALKLKILPVFQVFICGFIIWLLDKIYPVATINLPSNSLVAIVLIILGVLMVVLGGMAFRRQKTTVDPRDPSKSSALVIVGVYQYTRNPMYMGALLSLFGLVVYFGSVSGVFVLPLFIWCMNELQIKWEEKALLEKFGEPYKVYMENVRRWF